MQKTITKLNEELEQQLENIMAEETEPTVKYKKCVECLKKSLNKLRKFISNYSFKNQDEEIEFFKHVKPAFFSKYIYYGKLFNVESHFPMGSAEIKEAYLHNELDKIHAFHKRYFEFYHYYRSGSTLFDDRYFTRCTDDICLLDDCLMFYIDPNFSSLHDYTQAKIIANEHVQNYLNKRIDNLHWKSKIKRTPEETEPFHSEMTWTESKTALTELIYALCSTNCINSGKISLKQLTLCFEKLFNIKLGDVYHTFVEIRERQGSRTLFLDALRDGLKNRMDDIDLKIN